MCMCVCVVRSLLRVRLLTGHDSALSGVAPYTVIRPNMQTDYNVEKEKKKGLLVGSCGKVKNTA